MDFTQAWRFVPVMSTWEAEVAVLVSSRLPWATEWVWGRSRLQEEKTKVKLKVENKNNPAGSAVAHCIGRGGTFYFQGYPNIPRTGKRLRASSVSNQKPERHPLSLLPGSKKSWNVTTTNYHQLNTWKAQHHQGQEPQPCWSQLWVL